MTLLAEQFFVKRNHYVIILNGNDDEKVMIEEYMRYLQHYCTYNGMYGSDDSELTPTTHHFWRGYIR